MRALGSTTKELVGTKESVDTRGIKLEVDRGSHVCVCVGRAETL